MIMDLVDEAMRGGARQAMACELLGIDERTLQRWRRQAVGDDRRHGPRRPPSNKLSAHERRQVIETANLPCHRDLSPKQIVPLLADQGRYIASEATFYRILRAEGQVRHRERSRPPTQAKPRELVATGPNHVWTWDITYLPSTVKGVHYYLYMVLDIFSRKIVAWDVHDCESAVHAADLIASACQAERVHPHQLWLHQDNGGPMRCGTFQALLQELGVGASFSRPGVSDDNPFVEATFRTLKYRPGYPERPFATLQEARAFIAAFVRWYNTQHLHGSIRFVTPAARHAGEDQAILANRDRVYRRARERHPRRWSGATRDWSPVERVILNPGTTSLTENVA